MNKWSRHEENNMQVMYHYKQLKSTSIKARRTEKQQYWKKLNYGPGICSNNLCALICRTRLTVVVDI